MADINRKRKKTLGDHLLNLVLIAAVVIFVFAAFQLYRIYSEYKAGRDEYSKIEEMAVIPNPNGRLPDKDQSDGSDDDGQAVPPISVDFEVLKKENPDVIGWIYIEALDISYPIVKGKDNEEYLHTTYQGTYNFAGSIFIDYENSGNFTDCNTIVYGHNMKDGSMFGTLNRMVKENAYAKSPYFWILTPDANYRYEIFSSYTASVGGDTYTLFKKTGDEFEAYGKSMKEKSEIDTGDIMPTKADKIVTLSTCTGNDATRFVVQGIQRLIE